MVMIRSIRIRLKLTKEQELYCRQASGVARWVYNKYLDINFKLYEQFKLGNISKCNLSYVEYSKWLTQKKKSKGFEWLAEVNAKILQQEGRDGEKALKDYLKGNKDKPKFKARNINKQAFALTAQRFQVVNGGFSGNSLGYVRTTRPIPKIKRESKYINPRISYDCGYWYLSVGYEINALNVELTNEVIGVDLGVKELAVYSTGEKVKNINKSGRVKYLKKQLRRAERKLSRKREANIAKKTYYKNGSKKGQVKTVEYKKSLNDCKNYQKQKVKVQKINKKLKDIRDNHIHQATSRLVKAKPKKVVVEDLNIKGMIKNRHLAKAISEQKFYEFIRQLEYKCKYYNIEFVKADRWFASSKLCSGCGSKKADLKLSDRTYICKECGLQIDRDLNAAINLKNYQV